MADPQFRADLFRGTARAYEDFRPPYPPALIDDLAVTSKADGTGTLLDLACGPGLLGFALRGRFREVWAVDLEPEMIEVVRAKVLAAGMAGIRPVVAAAEELAAPAGLFQLVTIGNAFHRLQREAVAGKVLRWLRPGGWLAVIGGGSPWEGDLEWQRALDAFRVRWQHRVAARDGARVPDGWEDARRVRSDRSILQAAGFELAGARTWRIAHEWTPHSLAGFLASTSVLSSAALGDLAPDFAAELRRVLAPWSGPGGLHQELSYGCELARRGEGSVSGRE